MKKNAVENASEALGDVSDFVGDSKNFCYFSMFLYILYILYIYIYIYILLIFPQCFFLNTLDGKVEPSLLTFPITVLNFVDVLKELPS